MPIYEYHCGKCGQFEVMRRITESPLSRCPTCRGKVTKLISNTSFQLKGSGWYATDYARKDGNGKGAGQASAEGESASKPEKTEAKSETTSSKSETKSSKEATAA